MTVNHKKLKQITFDLGGSEFQVQLKDWKLNNDTDDPEILHTYGGPTEDFAEEADPAWSLDLVFYADWTVNGVSDYLTAHNGETLDFEITHHVGVSGWEHQRSGQVFIKAPSVGGEIRETELTEITLALVGPPTYTRS